LSRAGLGGEATFVRGMRASITSGGGLGGFAGGISPMVSKKDGAAPIGDVRAEFGTCGGICSMLLINACCCCLGENIGCASAW